jgi:FkbM family methyltransferase
MEKMMLPNKDIILPCHGMRILVRNPRRSLIGRSIYFRGLWEPEATQFISLKIKSGMTVLDIGADIGYYTLLFAKLVGSKGRVFSFEPIPKAKWYLDKNIEMNGLNNVRAFNFALFDKAGIACLEDPFTQSKINPSKKTLSENDIQVEMKVFDEWKLKEEIDQIDWVKLDVEGAELNVLRGMKSALQSYHPGILIEVHPQQLESFGFSSSAVIEFLSEFGYQIEPVDKPRIDFSQGNITLFCEVGKTL